MSYLPDEQWLMIKDSIDKKNVARSSHNKRSHCGKGGSVKFPSDYMTKKELKAMNGEVKSYRLNDPMTWKEFKKLPDDIKVAYIKNLREKYAVPNKDLAKAMGVNSGYFGEILRGLGLGLGKGAAGRSSKKWPGTTQALAFREFWYGSVESTEPSIDICEEKTSQVRYSMEHTNVAPVTTESFKEACTPTYGALSFECKAEDALDKVRAILAGTAVHMTITWSTSDSKED